MCLGKESVLIIKMLEREVGIWSALFTACSLDGNRLYFFKLITKFSIRYRNRKWTNSVLMRHIIKSFRTLARGKVLPLRFKFSRNLSRILEVSMAIISLNNSSPGLPFYVFSSLNWSCKFTKHEKESKRNFTPNRKWKFPLPYCTGRSVYQILHFQ